jgi:hypothetical protein
MNTGALGVAVYHAHSFFANRRPLVAFLDAMYAGRTDLTQWVHARRPTRRVSPSSAYDQEALLRTVSDGNATAIAVETSPTTVDGENEAIIADVAPLSDPPPEAIGRPWPYRVAAVYGSQSTASRGLSHILPPLLALADEISPLAGVIFPAESASFAHAFATGTFGGLTAEQERRVREHVVWKQDRFGEVIRGPEWGTFLSANHVARMGGMVRISAESQCAQVVPLRGGGAYLQVTAELPEAGDSLLSIRLAALAEFLEPVRG